MLGKLTYCMLWVILNGVVRDVLGHQVVNLQLFEELRNISVTVGSMYQILMEYLA